MNTTQTNPQTELQEKIAKLQKEYELKEKAAQKLGDIDHMTIVHGWAGKEKERVIVRAKNTSEVKATLMAYPTTAETTTIGTATDKYYKILQSPFRIDIDNPASPNQWNNFMVEIKYWSGETDMEVELPIEFVSEFVQVGERGLTDSEYHYFTGQPYTWLRNHRVREYRFKANSMGWYGGNKTLLDETEIKKIIDYLTA